MKKCELEGMLSALQNVRRHKGPKFTVWVARNSELIKKELELLNEGKKPSEEYLEYEQKRAMLAIEHSNKDEAGNAKLVKVNEELSKYDIIDIFAFEKAFAEVTDKYSQAIEDFKKQSAEYDKMMQEESEIVLNKISFDLLPEDIDGFETEGIVSLIE